MTEEDIDKYAQQITDKLLVYIKTIMIDLTLEMMNEAVKSKDMKELDAMNKVMEFRDRFLQELEGKRS